MALRKYTPSSGAPQTSIKPLTFVMKSQEKPQIVDTDRRQNVDCDVDIDIREVYFLIMHFLSTGPCHRTYGHLWNELLEHELLPRRYHAWYSRTGLSSGDENDDGLSLPLSYNNLIERYPHVEKGHLVSLLKQLLITSSPSRTISDNAALGAADVPSLLGTGVFSLLEKDRFKGNYNTHRPPIYMRWPHMKADQLRGLCLREIGGGFPRHHRAPSIRAACYTIAKPSTMVQKMQNIKRLRGHRNAVYCAIFDHSGRYVITGSDDRLVKIWSMDIAYCIASCRGHEGDITDLAVSPNNALVASSSNDCIIRVWRLPDGMPVSVLKGHTGVVTAITFSPRSPYNLLSSSDDGTCRIWDGRNSQIPPRIYSPRVSDTALGRENAPLLIAQSHQIFCCAFNANGTVFVTGSSDNSARVWSALKSNVNEPDHQVNNELDVLSGHENDVNYVQFSGCAVASRFTLTESIKEDNIPKFKNSWFTHDNIVTCSKDGSAIIWIPRSRRSHGKVGRWTRAYHLKVPPPPISPQPQRGGPRQRAPLTPRGVNMIVWSLDNRFVLAAIMDCRICVWNAADGSLVHSLTGHSQSTYVLDVHPFNPRIAMSAGYDGKTIIWDIWEGTPIKVYEISRFKLVDGKFSPDGTSIILSDDVGQLYILSTGQGESQNDAQYDQFFLGDYRPMIQDTHGNFLDQETQLTPYRRNLLDLLCDSSMIPYPEPYQSSYQRRRLGALNREWQPTTLKLSVGPDISLDRDYQMLPLPDLDMVVDPLPEFLDAMDWVPEIEVQSDDNDSEYNVTEDYLSGKEHVSVSSDSSRDLECSTDENDGDTSTLKDVSRRSRRRHMNADAEVMTSSGRRVKRRNFEECSEDIYKNNKSKKNPGRKALKKRSASNTLRPPRAAASKALTLFSKITGTSTDVEDGDESEDELSGSESLIQDSDIETYQSEDSLQTKHLKQIKGKEVATNGYTPMLKLDETLESHSNSKNRKKLILRFSRHPKSMVPSVDESTINTHAEIPGSSTGPHLDRAPSIISEGQLGNSSSASPDGFEDLNTEERQKRLIFREISGGTKDQTFRWGGARARSTKRRRTEEFAVFNRSEWSDFINSKNCGIPYAVKGPDRKNEAESCVSPKPKSQIHDRISDELVLLKEKHPDINIASHNGKAEYDGCGGSTKDGNVANDSYDNRNSDAVDQFDSRMKSTTTPTKLRIRSWSMLANANPIKSPLSETFFDGESERSGPVSILAQQNMNPSAETFHKDATIQHSERCEDNGTWESETQETGNNGSMTQDLFETRPHPGNKVINVFYRRSRSHKAKTNLEDDSGRGMESTSNASSEGNIRTDFHEGTAEGSRRTRSMGRRATGVISTGRVEHVSDDHQKPNTRITNGTRSGRSRRASDTFNDATLIERRKPNQSLKKISWLMTCVHDGIRYIPQMGDEVVYLRQGHQQYLTGVRGSRDVGPWQSIKGYVRAVEYCKVVDLNYATFPGSGESCCKLTLEFVDPASGVCGKSFKVTLPEDTGLPDFLVERSRFDAAVQRKWTQRDKCKVWWKNEGDEDGNWWEGRIIRVEPESVDFRDSPWERYTILYKSDPPEISRHSPWELCEHDTQWELPQQPQIEEGYREKLLDSFAELEESGNKAKDQYGIQKLKQASDKSYFRNRFPVPLSLEVIQARLENNYYRSLDALRHDIKIAMSNAESYFERNVEVAPKMRRLSEWFRRTLSYL